LTLHTLHIDDFFPADLDFSSFFGQLDNVPKDPTNSEGAPSLDAIRGINSNVPYNGNTENAYVNGNNSIPYVSNQNGDINGNNGRDNLYANIKLENPNQNQFQNQSQNVNQNQSVNQYQTVVKEEAGEEMDWDYLLSLGKKLNFMIFSIALLIICKVRAIYSTFNIEPRFLKIVNLFMEHDFIVMFYVNSRSRKVFVSIRLRSILIIF
jgi:hypothetical protein